MGGEGEFFERKSAWLLKSLFVCFLANPSESSRFFYLEPIWQNITLSFTVYRLVEKNQINTLGIKPDSFMK